MTGPVVMVVRETPSLADSVQVLLETLGFRVVVVDHAVQAAARLGAMGEEPVRALILASNRPRSELLRSFPDAFPPAARHLPILVVGDRAASERQGWPGNVHFVRLPFDGRQFVDLIDRFTHGSEEGADTPESPPESAAPASGP